MSSFFSKSGSFWDRFYVVAIGQCWDQWLVVLARRRHEIHSRPSNSVIAWAISGDVNWPHRSCDLPLFCYGAIWKTDFEWTNTNNWSSVTWNWALYWQNKQSDICKIVVQNFAQRANVYRFTRGRHLPDIIFHYEFPHKYLALVPIKLNLSKRWAFKPIYLLT